MLRPKAAILTIDVEAPVGGVPALVETLFRLLCQWGYDPVVHRAQIGLTLSRWGRLKAILKHIGTKRDVEQGRPTIIVPPLGLPIWFFYLNPYYLFTSLLSDYDVHLVVSGSAHVALPLALRRRPYALWVATLYEDELRAKADLGDTWAQGVLRSPLRRFLAWQERLSLQRAERILALSSHTAARISQLLPEAANRIETVLYPVDLSRFRPTNTLQETTYGKYILLAARINDRRKNVPLLLRAFAHVHSQHPDVKLVLAGEAPSEMLKELVAELDLQHVVVFRGLVSADELLELYQSATLFILPSAQEGLGIVALEAMACGTPVVTTSSGGPEGMVIEGVTGKVVERHDDPDALGAAITALLEKPELLAAMRKDCVRFAQDRYSLPAISAQLERVVKEIRSESKSKHLIQEIAVAGWVLFILGLYVQRQLVLHWSSIQTRLIEPLLGRVP